MIAYNKTKLLNLRIVKKAKQWYAKQLLTTEQFATITTQYKADFYTPTLFIKFGLFLFTWVCVLAAAGLGALLLAPAFDNGGSGVIAFLCFLFAGVCILLLETLIRQRKLYQSGIDEALLYAALWFAGCATGVLLSNWFSDTENTILLFCFLSLPLLAAAVLRYADTLISVVLFVCCYAIYFLLLLKLGDIAKLVMPFALMFLSLVVYILTKKAKQKEDWQYWETVMVVFEFGSLLFFYLSGNYYVIRESSVAFFDLSIAKGEDIPLAIFFYLFTAVVPLAYVFYGLKRKDKILLWTGLLVVAASAMTFKYYFSLGHPEILLTIAGIIVIGIAYTATRYFKTPRYGITFDEEPNEDHFLQTNAEALLQARSFQHAGHAPLKPHTEFGGGSSGGGGATGDW